MQKQDRRDERAQLPLEDRLDEQLDDSLRRDRDLCRACGRSWSWLVVRGTAGGVCDSCEEDAP